MEMVDQNGGKIERLQKIVKKKMHFMPIGTFFERVIGGYEESPEKRKKMTLWTL